MLLKHGADVHLRDAVGLQPVHYFLFATEAPGDDDCDGECSGPSTVLATPAAPDGGAPDDRFAVARALLERGADPHTPNTHKAEEGVETLAEQAAAPKVWWASSKPSPKARAGPGSSRRPSSATPRRRLSRRSGSALITFGSLRRMPRCALGV